MNIDNKCEKCETLIHPQMAAYCRTCCIEADIKTRKETIKKVLDVIFEWHQKHGDTCCDTAILIMDELSKEFEVEDE